MATHIVFFNFTQQGIERITESPKRVQEAREIVQSFGGTVKDFYAVMGNAACDTMFIVEAPDDDAIARAVLRIAQDGNVRTTTMRAFNEEEFKRITSGLAS